MHQYVKVVAVWILLTSLATAQQFTPSSTASAKLPSEKVVSAFLQQMFGYDSSLSWKITSIKPSEAAGLAEVDVTIQGPQGAQAQKFYVSPDELHAVVGQILPFGAYPFDAARERLEKEINGPARGPANAPTTVVEFSDLQCPHCKEAQPNLNRLAGEDKDVRIVFQNFPLPIHDWAMKAAHYADCIGRSSNESFWKFVEGVYGAQTDITAATADDKLKALADAAGVAGTEMAVCAAKPETTSRVEHSIALGTSLDVNSTPTIFINGRMLSAAGISYEVLRELVDFAAKNYEQRLNSAIGQLKSNHLTEAIEAAAALIQAEPNRWEGYGLAGAIAKAQNKLAEAKAMYQRALALAPDGDKPQILQALQELNASP